MTEALSPAAAGIRDALLASEQIESVERIKDLVSASLRAADSTIHHIARTSHFNNSFSPDLVIEWPRGLARNPRFVYLRPTQNPAFIADDVGLVGSSDSVFVALDSWRLDLVAEDALANVDQNAREKNSLVTRVEAVEAISFDRSNRPGVSLLASAVVSSGRGLVETEQAIDTANLVTQGFLGAQRADRDPTAQGVAAIVGALQPLEATRLTGVLQAVWTAAGGSAVDFPSDSPELSGQISPSALRFLLEFEDVEDQAFWERLARSVEFETITTMGNLSATDAFQRFMSAAAKRLRARACYVVDLGDSDTLTSGAVSQWSVENSSLKLAGNKYAAFLGSRLSDLPSREENAENVNLTQLRARAERTEYPVIELGLFDGESSLTYRSEVGSDVLPDPSTPALNDFYGPGMTVRRALLTARTGHKLEVNFNRMSCHAAGGRAQPPIREVLWGSVNLLVDLVDSERNDLRERIGFDSDDLFEEDNQAVDSSAAFEVDDEAEE
jgi:hypothetical protein